MPDIKQKAHEMFDERFGGFLDLHDELADVRGATRPDKKTKEFAFDFIDEIIDMAVAEEREKIKKEIQETLGYASLYKTLKNN